MMRYCKVWTRALVSLTFAITLMVGSHANGEGQFVRLPVVELFTSSGCSSCPSADDFFAKSLASRTDILPLAFHVDYWDYLGWKDEFAQPRFSDRQRDYAIANGLTMIYTPQMVIGGQEFVVGHNQNLILGLISKLTKQNSGSLQPFAVAYDGSDIVISVENGAFADQSYTAFLIRYLDSARTVQILAGENANKSIEYSNIVVSLDKAGTIGGSDIAELRVDAIPFEDQEIAVIIHEDVHGNIAWAGKLLR